MYGVVQRHKGTVQIESEVGRGTRIRVTFPFRTTATPLPSRVDLDAPAKTLHILVVDDEPLVREVVMGYLTAVGHTVDTAENGREGLERFCTGRYDLVVTDKGMPEMNGEQMAQAIKRQAPEKPIILLTGWGEQMTIAGEVPAGIDLLLSKPVSLSTLVDAVSRVMERCAAR